MRKLSEMVAAQESIIKEQDKLLLKTKTALEYINRMTPNRNGAAQESLSSAVAEVRRTAKDMWEQIRRYEMEMNDEENMYCEGCS